MTAKIAGLTLRFPDDLTERDQWVLWRYEARNHKPAKVPYQAGGCRADSTNPQTWTTFENALDIWNRWPRRYAGLGFVFTKSDPFAGIDLDNALDDEGDVKRWTRGVVERFADTYMEISPSGRGLKIWARGALPANVPGIKVEDGVIELYDHARYFAVTGRTFRGAPPHVEDHSTDLVQLYERLTSVRKGWPIHPLPGGRIPYGRQHNTLVSLCGTLRARGICEEAIEACLQIINQKQCERPGAPQEISRIVSSSRKWGIR